MPKHPTVSVCIPSYNGEQHIAATIESVLAQTYADWELAVADDASTDRTVRIVASFKDPRIRLLINERNVGPGENWTRAVRAARGRYIKLLCHDDVIYPGCLEAQVIALERAGSEGVVMVCCRRDIIDDGGRILLRDRGFTSGCGRLAGPAAIHRIARSGTNLIGEPLAVLFRATALSAAGGFDDTLGYCVDVDFWCRLLARGDLYVLPETLGAFRVSARSWSVSLARDQGRQGRRFLRRLRAAGIAPIGRADLMLGCARCTLNAGFRQLLYLLHPNLQPRRPV